MLNVTVICYLISLMFYGMGSSKMGDLNNAVTATSYFVLAIFFAVIGFMFYYVKNKRTVAIIESRSSNLMENPRGNRIIENARAS